MFVEGSSACQWSTMACLATRSLAPSPLESGAAMPLDPSRMYSTKTIPGLTVGSTGVAETPVGLGVDAIVGAGGLVGGAGVV